MKWLNLLSSVPKNLYQKVIGKNLGNVKKTTREKGALFDKWCQANKVTTFAELREFKSRLPEKIAV